MIDEYDLGEHFKRWAAKTRAQVVTFVLAHLRPVAYSAVSLLALTITWWVIAHHRPAEPPPPSAWRMRQMMKAVDDADKRFRAENADRLGETTDFRGVFETMRDVPIPLNDQSRATQSQTQPQLPEVQQ